MNLILNINLSASSVTESTVRTLSVLGTCLPSPLLRQPWPFRNSHATSAYGFCSFLLLPRPSSLSAVTETHMLYFLCNVVLVPEKISIIVL